MRTRIAVVLLVIAALAVVALVLPVRAQQRPPVGVPSVTGWEYCVVGGSSPIANSVTYFTTQGSRRETVTGVDNYVQMVAKLGMEGWELVAIDASTAYYFKRPVR